MVCEIHLIPFGDSVMCLLLASYSADQDTCIDLWDNTILLILQVVFATTYLRVTVSS